MIKTKFIVQTLKLKRLFVVISPIVMEYTFRLRIEVKSGGGGIVNNDNNSIIENGLRT